VAPQLRHTVGDWVVAANRGFLAWLRSPDHGMAPAKTPTQEKANERTPLTEQEERFGKESLSWSRHS